MGSSDSYSVAILDFSLVAHELEGHRDGDPSRELPGEFERVAGGAKGSETCPSRDRQCSAGRLPLSGCSRFGLIFFRSHRPEDGAEPRVGVFPESGLSCPWRTAEPVYVIILRCPVPLPE